MLLAYLQAYYYRSCYGDQTLHKAVRDGRVGLIDKLLALGFGINSYSTAGLSPLAVAILFRTYECAASLIEHGADLNHLTDIDENDTGKFIQRCLTDRSIEIILALVIFGANIESSQITKLNPKNSMRLNHALAARPFLAAASPFYVKAGCEKAISAWEKVGEIWFDLYSTTQDSAIKKLYERKVKQHYKQLIVYCENHPHYYSDGVIFNIAALLRKVAEHYKALGDKKKAQSCLLLAEQCPSKPEIVAAETEIIINPVSSPLFQHPRNLYQRTIQLSDAVEDVELAKQLLGYKI